MENEKKKPFYISEKTRITGTYGSVDSGVSTRYNDTFLHELVRLEMAMFMARILCHIMCHILCHIILCHM